MNLNLKQPRHFGLASFVGGDYLDWLNKAWYQAMAMSR